MRILLAAESMSLSRALPHLLKFAHYTTDVVHSGEEALKLAADHLYDCIILDVCSHPNSAQTTRLLREQGCSAPVMILAKDPQKEDIVQGLDMGADDFLQVPFDDDIFLARLRALTRRKGAFVPAVRTVGNTTLNQDSFELSTPGLPPVRLSRKEYQIFLLLLDSRGKLVATEKIMDTIWGVDASAELSVVWVYISYLRRKLHQIKSNVQINGVRGLGYELEVLKK